MTQSDSPSRRRRPSGPSCKRESCPRRAGAGYEHCSLVCAFVDDRIDQTQRVCQTIEDTEHWVSVVTLSDALSDFWRSESRMYHAAMSQGFTDSEWRALKMG